MRISVRSVTYAWIAALVIVSGGCKDKIPENPEPEVTEQDSEPTEHAPAGKAAGILAALSKSPGEATPSGPQDALEDAIFDGDVEALNQALEQGADADHVDEYGDPILHTACEGPSLDVLKALVAGGADAGAVNKYGDTCLHVAAGNAPLEIVAYLLAEGADPNAPHDRDDRPLQRALTSDPFSMEKVKLLIEKGADPSRLGDGKDTTLHVFYRSGCPKWESGECPTLEVVELLVDGGADIHGVNAWGETPLHHAAGVHDLPVVEYLVKKGADVNAGNMDGWTPLDYAHQSPYDAASEEPIDESDPDRKSVMKFLAKKGGKSVKKDE